ncbi:MAG: hypothetical protein ACHQIH_02750 [Ignavibacteria bacterium]
MEILKVLTLVVQMGMPLTFPDGEASLQQPLADKIEVICKDEGSTQSGTLHELKNNAKFEKTGPSLFTKENTRNLYIFLTHIDSTQLYVEDCDYSMLKFLRVKNKKQNLNYSIIDSVTYFVNNEKLRLVRWPGSIGYYIYENNTVFETSFDSYFEYWECSNKFDYSPKYPYTNPKRTPLRKNYTDEQSEDLKYILTNPIMVFSVIPLDENSFDLPYNLEGTSTETTLETTKGKNIDGMGIDLNGDKILDAFWYHEIQDSKIVRSATRLYINLEGKWIPVWYTYFSEM